MGMYGPGPPYPRFPPLFGGGQPYYDPPGEQQFAAWVSTQRQALANELFRQGRIREYHMLGVQAEPLGPMAPPSIPEPDPDVLAARQMFEELEKAKKEHYVCAYCDRWERPPVKGVTCAGCGAPLNLEEP